MGTKNSQKIEDSIRTCLLYIRDNVRGKMAEIASVTGISKGQLSKYASGATKSAPSEYLEKLLPYIKEYSSRLPFPSEELPTTKTNAREDKKLEEIVLRTFSPGQQIITGVINVYGVPNEKIIEAIRTVNLSEDQRNELTRKIFS